MDDNEGADLLPMLDHVPFIHAIADSPHDPAPIWIYADWLEEQGELDRAQFIRIQTEWAGLSDGDPRKIDLAIENRRWLDKRRRDWLGELPNWTWIDWHGFEDGLPRVVNLDGGLKTNVEGAFEGIYQIAPVSRLRFSRLTEDGSAALADCSLLRRITAIEIADDPGPASAIEGLLRSPHLRNLRQLICPALTSILRRRPIGEWLDSFELPSLERLVLTGKPICDPGAASLARSRTLGRLTALGLADHRLTETGVEAILDSPGLGPLRELDLEWNGLDRQSAERMARLPAMACLTRLSLANATLGDRGAEALAQSPHSANLVTLDLRGNQIGDRGLAAILRLCKTGSLARLKLRSNPIRLRGAALSPKRSFPCRLLSLSLDHVEIEADAIGALIESPWFANLRSLCLDDNPIGGAVAEAIRRFEPRPSSDSLLSSLRQLSLRRTGMTDSGAAALRDSPALVQLRELDLNGNDKISEPYLDAIRERFGTESIPEPRGLGKVGESPSPFL